MTLCAAFVTGAPVEVGLLRFEPTTVDVTLEGASESATAPQTKPAGLPRVHSRDARGAGPAVHATPAQPESGGAPDTIPAGIRRDRIGTAAEPARVAPAPASGSTAAAETPAIARRHDVPVLDAYRGLAALMVVMTHVGFSAGAAVGGPWAGWLSRLDIGVALFFLISGFLLFRPFVQAAYGLRPRVELTTYFRRRCVRIYPPFLLAVAGVYALLPKARAQSDEVWLQTIFLVRNYFSAFGNQLFGLMQSWSLVVEVSFYVMLPLLARLILGPGTSMAVAVAAASSAASSQSPGDVDGARTRRWVPSLGRRSAFTRHLSMHRPAIVLALLFLGSIAWQIATLEWDEDGTTRLWLPTYLDWFVGGMGLAWLRERSTPVPLQMRYLADAPGVCMCLALVGYWLTTTRLGGPYDLSIATFGQAMFKHFMYVLIAALLLVPAVFGPPGARWRRYADNPVMTWLGNISFGVFLWHVIVMERVRDALNYEPWRGGFWVTLAVTLIVSMAVGTVSWRYVEEPALRRFRYGFRPSTQRAQSRRQPAVPPRRSQAQRA